LRLPWNIPQGTAQIINELMGIMDMEKRDRFELLSAYLDGEVSSAERRQVEEWIDTDPSVKCQYLRLLRLRSGLQNIPVEATQCPEEMVQQVWKKLRYRSRWAWALGGAIAVCAISISGLIPGSNYRNLQIAQQSTTTTAPAATQPEAPASPLMVAINNPVIEIPKTAVVSNKKPRLRTPSYSTRQEIN
jgi:predicted anti-sigma-YlaC factor YlaD